MAFKKDDPNINRRGRPKTGKAISEQLRAHLSKPEEKERFVKHLLELFYKEKSLQAGIEILNRTEGKVKEEIKLETTVNEHVPDQKEGLDMLDKFKKSEDNVENEQEQVIQ